MADPDPNIEALAARMLKRIGWNDAEWVQIEVYAKMAPARKVTQMLKLRHKQVRVLDARLRREHPGLSKRELALLIQEHLDLVRETR
ncbi:MAG TPA: hypothetical protein VGE45_14895 [Chloroflexia bacterium]